MSPLVEAGVSVSGLILDRAGRPVSGARVIVRGRAAEFKTEWLPSSEAALTVVSDSQGRFRLPTETGWTAYHVTVQATDFAPLWSALNLGRDPILVLPKGAAVSGKVVSQGKGVRDVVVVAETEARGPGLFLNGFLARTGGDGEFVMSHLPANTRFVLSTSLRGRDDGSMVPARVIRTLDDGLSVGVGDLALVKVTPMRGRVELKDEVSLALSAKAQVILIRDRFQDQMETSLNLDGSFEFPAVPIEVVALRVDLPNYRVSGRNRSLDSADPRQLLGFWSGDVYPLRILVEPGDPLKPMDVLGRPVSNSPEDPLKGVD